MWIGLAIHAFISLAQLADSEMLFFYLTFPFVIANIVGIFLIISGKVKTGAIVFMVGSVAFIPIGLIGFFGARSVLNKLKQKDFYKELNTLENESN